MAEKTMKELTKAKLALKHMEAEHAQEKTSHAAKESRQAQKLRDVESTLAGVEEEHRELLGRERQYEKKIKEQTEKLQAAERSLMRLEASQGQLVEP